MIESRKRRFDGDSETRDRISKPDSSRRQSENWSRSSRNPITFQPSGRNDRSRLVGRVQSKTRVDRHKTCPMLIRVFYEIGKHHKISDFVSKFPENELFIYTWRDATLREIMGLVCEVLPSSRIVGTCFDFKIVYPNFKLKTYEMKDLGTTFSGQDRNDDSLTLDSTKFQIGDCLDVAIFPPKQRLSKL